MARSTWAAGARRGDVVHMAYGYGLFAGGLGAHYGAGSLGATVVPVSGGMTEHQAQLINDVRPRVIMVTPSYFLSVGTARPAMRRMEKITGRSDDLMIVRGVNLFPTQIEEIVLGLSGLSPYSSAC